MLNQDYFMKNGIEVMINDMKYGDTLFSRDYSICNALIFTNSNIAALAHISNATSPEILLQGYVSNLLFDSKKKSRRIQRLGEIFNDIQDVAAHHIYRDDCCWANHTVVEALKSHGIKKIYPTSINDPAFRTRDIGISMKENKIYIFPKSYSETEKNPIMLDINKKSNSRKKLNLDKRYLNC